MACMAIFMVVAIAMALMAGMITSVIYMIAIFRLNDYLRKTVNEKED